MTDPEVAITIHDDQDMNWRKWNATKAAVREQCELARRTMSSKDYRETSRLREQLQKALATLTAVHYMAYQQEGKPEGLNDVCRNIVNVIDSRLGLASTLLYETTKAKIATLEEVITIQDSYEHSGFDRVGVQELIEKYRREIREQ